LFFIKLSQSHNSGCRIFERLTWVIRTGRMELEYFCQNLGGISEINQDSEQDKIYSNLFYFYFYFEVKQDTGHLQKQKEIDKSLCNEQTVLWE